MGRTAIVLVVAVIAVGFSGLEAAAQDPEVHWVMGPGRLRAAS